MYNIAELEKISELTDVVFSAYQPYVYQAQVTFPTVATFFTDTLGADDTTNKTTQSTIMILETILKVWRN